MYRGEKELSREDKLKIAAQITETEIRHVCISGGEPLLLPELRDIVKILRDGNISVSVFTSGLIHDENLVQYLNKLETFFYISVDGDPETHNMIREGTWEKVSKFLNYLRHVGASFGTCMAISKLNYDKTGKYVDTVLRYDPDSISVIPVMPSGRALETGIYVDTSQVKIALSVLREECEKYGIRVHVWCLPCLRAYVDSPYLIAGSCRSWNVIDVSPSGRFLICDILNVEVCRWDINERFSDLIETYRESELYKRSRKTPPECLRCRFVSLCRGGCFSRAYIRYGVFERKDPLCPL